VSLHIGILPTLACTVEEGSVPKTPKERGISRPEVRKSWATTTDLIDLPFFQIASDQTDNASLHESREETAPTTNSCAVGL